MTTNEIVSAVEQLDTIDERIDNEEFEALHAGPVESWQRIQWMTARSKSSGVRHVFQDLDAGEDVTALDKLRAQRELEELIARWVDEQRASATVEEWDAVSWYENQLRFECARVRRLEAELLEERRLAFAFGPDDVLNALKQVYAGEPVPAGRVAERLLGARTTHSAKVRAGLVLGELDRAGRVRRFVGSSHVPMRWSPERQIIETSPADA